MFKNFILIILPYEIMSKNIMESERPQMTTQYGAYALHAG
jgi:hypothetical protein